MLPCTGEDPPTHVFTNWSMRSTPKHVCYGWLGSLLSWSAHMVHLSNASWHCWIVCCFWERFTWSFWGIFYLFSLQEEPSSNARPTRADWMFGWLVLSDLTATEWDLAEPISCSWCGWSLEGIEDAWVTCGEDCMWSRCVSITFLGVCNHVVVPPWF